MGARLATAIPGGQGRDTVGLCQGGKTATLAAMMERAARPLAKGMASAVALLLFLVAYGSVAGPILGWVFEWLEESPRLVMFALLLIMLGPIALVACIHRASHGLLDRFDPGRPAPRGLLPAASNFWAGFVALFVSHFASLTVFLLQLVIDPPRPDAMHATSLVQALRLVPKAIHVQASLGTQTALWLAIATLVFAVEAQANPAKQD
jgi:hypothetical protein